MMLKPCPFCGGKPVIRDHRTVWTIECRECEASVIGKRAPEPEGEMPDEYWKSFERSATACWNRRTVDQRIAELEAEMVRMQELEIRRGKYCIRLEKDAERYRKIRRHITPRQLFEIGFRDLGDLTPSEAIGERIDQMVDNSMPEDER